MRASTATVLTTLLIASLIAGVIAEPIVGDEIDPEFEIAKAYCYQAYGDAEIHNEGSLLGHGRFHCAANDGDPHYHDVTQEAKLAALRANQSGQQVNWAVVGEYRYKPWYERGFWPAVITGVYLVGALVFVGLTILYAPWTAWRGR